MYWQVSLIVYLDVHQISCDENEWNFLTLLLYGELVKEQYT